MFVLDTNTLVYFFRGEGEVARRLLSTAPADIAVPTVVVYELETGIAKSKDAVKRRGQLDQLLQVVSGSPSESRRRRPRRRSGLVWSRRALPSDRWTPCSPGRPSPTVGCW